MSEKEKTETQAREEDTDDRELSQEELATAVGGHPLYDESQGAQDKPIANDRWNDPHV